MNYVLGIDPGVSGALALVVDNDVLDFADMPVLKSGTRNRQVVDPHGLIAVIDRMRLVHDISSAVVERVGVRPGEGAVGAFSFGRGCGVIDGVLAALKVPVSYVTPAVWKRALSVPAAKDGARARASQIFPDHAGLWPLVKHDGRAEAAMIAYYGRDK